MIFIIVLAVLFVIPQIASAAGTLKSYGSGLWDYYGGKSRSWVKSHAPEFVKITSERYLLDEAVLSDVELYLLGDFQNDKLVVLQIMTPYPDYTRCSDDIKELSYTFAAVGSEIMGIDFTVRSDCMIDDGTAMCMNGKKFCVFDLCPEEMGAYACTTTDLMGK